MSAQRPIGPEKKAANDHDEAARLIAEIRAEMEKAGIRDDDPIMPLLLGLIDLFERMRRLSQSVVGRLDGASAMVEAEIARMRAAIAASEAQTKKIEASVSSIDVRAHNLLTQTIDRMAAEVAGKMRERMVIVEERYNRFVLWRTGAFIAVVLLATLGGGYAWRAYSDRDATALLERCTTSPFQDPSTGQFYCQFGRSQALQ
jgi:hypothetical protein